jgi:hypothetical protein
MRKHYTTWEPDGRDLTTQIRESQSEADNSQAFAGFAVIVLAVVAVVIVVAILLGR